MKNQSEEQIDEFHLRDLLKVFSAKEKSFYFEVHSIQKFEVDKTIQIFSEGIFSSEKLLGQCSC